MSDHSYLDNLMPDFGEYSPESILDNYRKRVPSDESAFAAEPAIEPARSAEAIAQRSRQIVMEALGDTLSQYKPTPEPDTPVIVPAEPPAPEPELKAEEPPTVPEPEETAVPVLEITGTLEPEEAQPKPEEAHPGPEEAHPEPEETHPEPEETHSESDATWTAKTISAPSPKRNVHISPDGIITLSYDAPKEEAAPTDTEPDDEPDMDAETDAQPKQSPPKRPAWKKLRRPAAYQQQDKPGVAERFLLPLIRMAATALAKRQMQKAEAANWPDPVEYRETEEMSPRRAAKFYQQQLRPLRFRCRVSVFLCVVLAWIALGLPMAGSLGKSLQVQAGVSLLLLLTIMMATLDILAAGVRQLFDLRPGGEALATLASLLAAVDAIMVMLGYSDLLPFCAVGGAALTCALWGERFSCLARSRTLRTAAMSKTPSVIASDDSDRHLFRTQQSTEGTVRRSEQADFCQSVYTTAAPVFLVLCLVLSILASLDGKGAYFLHTLSALLSVSASFAAFLSFPLPYALTARKLQSSGAAIIGYPGCADIGKTKRVVISDDDIFPPGTVRLSGINILEGAFVDKVISCTTGLLAASGSGVTGVFMELVTRRGYSMVQADEFKCHEGGGLSATVGGESILVGSAGFMNLMGIRLPQNLPAKNAVCTAISGELVGVFTLEYIPVTSVQEALVTMLHGRTQPVFAIRDFNITPLMIRQLFRLPTDNFNFPTFRDRYRITADQGRTSAAAVISRTGMGPMVDAAVSGRKLYNACRVSTFISLAGTAIGLLTMFLLCRSGAYDTATAGNVLSYMVLWALPVVILSIGQSR